MRLIGLPLPVDLVSNGRIAPAIGHEPMRKNHMLDSTEQFNWLRSMIHPRHFPSAIVALALSFAALAADDVQLEREVPVEITVRSVTATTMQRRAADLRRQEYERTYRSGESVAARAEAGDCNRTANRKASRYREILASAATEAAKALDAFETSPGKAASLYVRAEKIARGVVTGAAALDCVATSH